MQMMLSVNFFITRQGGCSLFARYPVPEWKGFICTGELGEQKSESLLEGTVEGSGSVQSPRKPWLGKRLIESTWGVFGHRGPSNKELWVGEKWGACRCLNENGCFPQLSHRDKSSGLDTTKKADRGCSESHNSLSLGKQWVQAAVCYLSVAEGGQGLVNIHSKIASFKPQTAQWLLHTSGPSWLLRRAEHLGNDKWLFFFYCLKMWTLLEWRCFTALCCRHGWFSRLQVPQMKHQVCGCLRILLFFLFFYFLKNFLETQTRQSQRRAGCAKLGPLMVMAAVSVDPLRARSKHHLWMANTVFILSAHHSSCGRVAGRRSAAVIYNPSPGYLNILWIFKST